DKAKKRRNVTHRISIVCLHTKIFERRNALMKKVLAIFVSVLLLASLSIAAVGCKKAEEAKAPAVEAPAAPAAPAAAPAETPAAPAAPAAEAPAPAPAK
ncbi:MAG: hypothetical protein ABFD59_03290, partial [Smithella sp.]